MSVSNPQSTGSQDSTDEKLEKILAKMMRENSNRDQEKASVAKAKAAILAWHNTQLKTVLESLREAMENDSRPMADWYREPFQCMHELIDDMQANLEKQGQ